ncbi:hypothetical protein P9112_014216 [Eukaryota sp. TZLM1-RC]
MSKASLLFDLGRSTLSSIAATFFDALVFAVSNHITGSVSTSAMLGAILGGSLHYVCCSKYIYNRFPVSRLYSVLFYFFLCWSGATMHMFLTVYLCKYVAAHIAWPLSRACIFVFFTFPLSRFVVFGGAAPRIEKQLIRYLNNIKAIKRRNFLYHDYDV